MSADYNEEAYENALIELLQNMGWEHVYGPEIDRDWHSPLYDSVLENSIRRLNPKASPAAIDEALLKPRHFENAELKKKNTLFMEWKTKDGNMESKSFADFTTFFEGIFQKDRLLDIIKNFICFNTDGINSYKILAGYHQYFAVRKAKRGMSSPRSSQQAVLRYPFCGLKRRPQRLLQTNLSRFRFLHTVK